MNQIGHQVGSVLGWTLPGNIIGIGLLLILLATGVVKVEWIELSATLLTRHMAFFFIPITVGVMGFSDLFKNHGIGIFAALAISGLVGLIAAGWSIQAVKKIVQINAVGQKEHSENQE